jgi:hypothetical protein
MERNKMLRVSTETKAVLQTEGTGRIVGFIKSTEPGKISVAVPNDRAVMTPAQARQFAAWLLEEAEKITASTTDARTSTGWRQAEAKRQADIRAALDVDRVGGFRRGY